ncbi:MAG: 3-phosphoserine/phosphohydroxythreonine transaminase [Leptospirales bacterium]|nr:3-phosphoserine/phosphohydroxythreonine transaminase [Leptospirales bacterium]
MRRVYNFSPGPAALPLPVLETIRDEMLDYQGTGMSIMEMSHRGKVFEGLLEDINQRLRKLASIPDRFDILYMTGGASAQFAFVPMNLSKRGNSAGYVNTGVWSEKAIEQAKLLGINAFDAGSSKDKNHSYIPNVVTKPGLDYLHITSNNTIYGTQFKKFPDPGDTKLIVDMSSDFLSRPIDWNKMGLVYAGAQKNAGASGITLAIIDRDYYAREPNELPTVFRYSTYGKNQSLYNTPPTFQIYVFGLVLSWIEKQGGLAEMARYNERKADHIYSVMDEFPKFYAGHSVKNARSLMNITFRLPSEELEQKFLKLAEERKLMGLKGHRSVGGLRASVYNAVGEEACQVLSVLMREFARQNGG